MMHHSKWWVGMVLTMIFCVGARADNHMHKLDITVTLSDNGSALVEEVRQYTINDDRHTEFYMPMNLPADMSLSAFSVEEDGVKMLDSSPWDIDLSRESKKGRYGIVDKGDNRYELCFGMGDNGDHTFRLRYTIGNMLRLRRERRFQLHVLFTRYQRAPRAVHAHHPSRRPSAHGRHQRVGLWLWR